MAFPSWRRVMREAFGLRIAYVTCQLAVEIRAAPRKNACCAAHKRLASPRSLVPDLEIALYADRKVAAQSAFEGRGGIVETRIGGTGWIKRRLRIAQVLDRQIEIGIQARHHEVAV